MEEKLNLGIATTIFIEKKNGLFANKNFTLKNSIAKIKSTISQLIEVDQYEWNEIKNGYKLIINENYLTNNIHNFIRRLKEVIPIEDQISDLMDINNYFKIKKEYFPYRDYCYLFFHDQASLENISIKIGFLQLWFDYNTIKVEEERVILNILNKLLHAKVKTGFAKSAFFYIF